MRRLLITILCVLSITNVFAENMQQQQTQAIQQPQSLPPTEKITYDQIDNDVKHYDAFGLHRAGSLIDNRTRKWIKDILKRDKLKVSVEPYTFNRPVSRYAVVSMKTDRINSVILPGMPLLNAKPTNQPINTKLGFVGQDGTVPIIHIYVTPPSGNADLRVRSLKEFEDAIKSGRYPAVIGVTQGGYEGLLPLTVDLNKHYDTPAMLMSSEIGNFAEIYAEINVPVKFLTRLQYKKSIAENIVGKIQGTNSALSPIVILVSRSAWWHAAAERGSGVAAFLSAAKALATVPHRRTIYFVSTTGQEYYSLGLQKFLEAHPSLVKNAYAWIYIGESIGTKPIPHYILQSSSRRMQRLVNRILEEYKIEHLHWADPTPVVLPPLAPIFQHSDHALIIAATNNRCSRMTCDRWPSNVNIEATVDFSKALVTLVQQLAAEE